MPGRLLKPLLSLALSITSNRDLELPPASLPLLIDGALVGRPPKNRYELVHERFSQAIPGLRNFSEAVPPERQQAFGVIAL